MKSSVTLFRHILACLLLVAAWTFLERWYHDAKASGFVFFSACFAGGFLLGTFPVVRSVVIRAGWTRRLFVIALLVLALPWGEWLHLQFSTSREDWSRQVFFQACFLYGFIIVGEVFPALYAKVYEKTLRLLDRFSPIRYSPWIAPIIFFLVTSFMSLFVFQKTTIVLDSSAHIFQAKIFRAFHLYAPAPPIQDAFAQPGDALVIHDGRWFSMYFPGFSAMLALAMLFHGEWLLCPFLGSATIAIWIAYARRWHQQRTALLLGILCLFSPSLLLMSSTIMIHTPEAFLTSAGIYLCRRITESRASSTGVLLFATIFTAAITRGFSMIPFLAPIFVCAAWQMNQRLRLQFCLLVSFSLISGFATVAWFQAKTTGSAWLPAYDLEYHEAAPSGTEVTMVPYGFGKNVMGQTHTPLRGLENISNDLLAMNEWQTGWYCGSLIFLVLFLLSAPRFDSWDRALLCSCSALVLFYFFYVFQDLVLGPRYWFPMVPVLFLFMARLASLEGVARNSVPLMILSLILFLPRTLPNYMERFIPTFSQAGKLHAEFERSDTEKKVIFLDPRSALYFVNWNDPFFRDRLIISHDLGPRNVEVLKAFPGYRPAYFRYASGIVKGKLQTGFSVVDTPDPRPPGYLSLFDFCLAAQTATDYSDSDIFDTSYAELMRGTDAVDMLGYLKSELDKPRPDPEYKKSLRFGMIHAAIAVVIPKMEFENRREHWKDGFDYNAFRSEYSLATRYVAGAGEVGKGFMAQLKKIAERIDINRDGKFSDEEIQVFLEPKMKAFELH